MKNLSKIFLICLIICLYSSIKTGYSQEFEFTFGYETRLSEVVSGETETMPVRWININTKEDTWSIKDDILFCTGHPIGVMRSEKQYENFILHIEWKHMEQGGNSGVFIWSNATPPEGKLLPDGVEVQMLEHDYFVVNPRPGISKINQEAYVHGHLFGVGGVETLPDNRMGTSNRSNSLENRTYGRGHWNEYVVVAVDGVVKLSVNGKIVNGISQASQKKGYICLESEGGEIHFRNIRIIELPSGLASDDQTAPVLD